MARAAPADSDALKAVLESNTFRRADVLRSILEYLYQQELQGRGHAVTEYEVGVHALGRPEDFSPETDSSVRTRMHALRRKLEEYYAGEGSESDVRVELPRGTYALRFMATATPAEPPVAPPQPAPVPSSPPRGRYVAGGALVVLLVAALGFATLTVIARDPDAGLERAAWGPLLHSKEPVVVAVGAPLQFYVRDFGNAPEPIGDPAFRLPVPRSPELLRWYQQWQRSELGSTAILHPNHHSPLWGDSAAAALVSSFLGLHGVQVSLVPAYRTHAVALRERNAVVVGRGEYNAMVSSLTPEDGFTITYSPAQRLMGVANRKPRSGEPSWWFASPDLKRNYGLITVRPSDSGGRYRTMMFSGINSDGAEAGAKFMTSPDVLKELDKWFRNAGYREWPSKFQVVVRTDSVDSYSLQTRFEAARVLP